MVMQGDQWLQFLPEKVQMPVAMCLAINLPAGHNGFLSTRMDDGDTAGKSSGQKAGRNGRSAMRGEFNGSMPRGP